MVQIRRWFIDWTGGATGGGGTSSLWFGTVQGTTNNVNSIEAFLSSWEDLASDDYTARLRTVADIFEDSTGQKVGEEAPHATTLHTGEVTTAQLPNQTQAVLSFLTPAFIEGRRLRGRIFIPGIAAASNFDGQPNATDLGTLLGHFPMTGQVVFSQKYHQSFAPSSAQAMGEWAVLRRRRD